MSAVCHVLLFVFAAHLSLSHSTTIHNGAFPQLRTPSPISSLASISKQQNGAATRSQRRTSIVAAPQKHDNAPRGAKKILLVGDAASELVRMISQSRRLKRGQASGFFIEETTVRSDGREELCVMSLNGTTVKCGSGNAFDPEAFESVVVPALTARSRIFLLDGIGRHLTAFSPSSFDALSALLYHPTVLVVASVADHLLCDPSALAALPLQDNPAISLIDCSVSSRESAPLSLRQQSAILLQHLTSQLETSTPFRPDPPRGRESRPRSTALGVRSRSRSPVVAMERVHMTRSFSPVQEGLLPREQDRRQRLAAATLEREVRRTRLRHDRRTSQLRSKAAELDVVRQHTALQLKRWRELKTAGLEQGSEEEEQQVEEDVTAEAFGTDDQSEDSHIGDVMQVQDAF